MVLVGGLYKVLLKFMCHKLFILLNARNALTILFFIQFLIIRECFRSLEAFCILQILLRVNAVIEFPN